MAGHWRQAGAGGLVEERGMPARGGRMLGLNRTVREGRERAQFEYLRIERDGDGAVYLASPGGAEPTPFRLVEADERRAVFANPEHDFPKRIEYRIQGNRLVSSIAGDPPDPSWTVERAGKFK